MLSNMIPKKQLPANFQRLTEDDQAQYETELCLLSPPTSSDPKCEIKRQKWLQWRAAPYPDNRHSEYLSIPEKDSEHDSTRILVSAIMCNPRCVEDYLSMRPRKNRYDLAGKKALSRGYMASKIKPNNYSEEIWEIIHSSDSRQGRFIAPRYWNRPPDYSFPDYEEYSDPHYQDICCGVFSSAGQLVAYLLGKRVGHHVQYDEIMGHSEHLHNDVVYLLHYHFLKLNCAAEIPPKFLNYGPCYSGTNPYSSVGGLNRWKRKVGFHPAYLILVS